MSDSKLTKSNLNEKEEHDEDVEDEEEELEVSKPKYDPNRALPVPEPGAGKLPTSKYRNVKDVWRKLNPKASFTEFRKEHGELPDTGKGKNNINHPYKSHPSYVEAKRLFYEDKEETKRLKKDFAKKFKNAAEFYRLSALKARHDNKLNPEVMQQRDQKKKEAENKKKRENEDVNTERTMKFMRYFPDPVQQKMSSLERTVNSHNMELTTMVASIQNKNAEAFEETMSEIHDFYKQFNE